MVPPFRHSAHRITAAMAVGIVAIGGLADFPADAEDPPSAEPTKPQPAVTIRVVPGQLRYSVSEFDAHAGSKLVLVFENNGLMPHNLLVVQPDQADAMMNAAMALGANGLAASYLPESAAVLAATDLLQPGESDTLSLALADSPGDYPYLCTFPGHGTIMRGVIHVRPRGEKLQAAVEVAVAAAPPPADASGASSGMTPLPMGSRERPLVVRTFLPNLIRDPAVLARHRPAATAAGYNPDTGRDTDEVLQPDHGLPAAIAVSFGEGLSIAWDTVECRWLYAWRGGFLDMTDYWGPGAGDRRKSFDYLPEILGDLVYLGSGPAPLSVSVGAGEVKFYGYRLIDGVPEFLYTVGRLKVAERIEPGDDGESIVQHFSVERSPVDLMLSAPSQPRATNKDEKSAADTVSVVNGKRSGDYAIVAAKQAGDFSLVHKIGPAIERPDAPAPITSPIPLLTQNPPPKKDSAVAMAAPGPSDSPPTQDQPGKAEPASRPVIKARPVILPSKPAPPAKAPPAAPAKERQPIIGKAERFDREILLTNPQVEPSALKPASTAFADRDFKFVDLPEELIGADYVRTYDRDKYIPGEILSYRLKLEADATVYLLFDSRLDPLPKWTGKRFADTGKTASLDSKKSFRILRADVDAGEVRFGPQDSGAGAHFYIIAVTPRSASGVPEKSE